MTLFVSRLTQDTGETWLEVESFKGSLPGWILHGASYIDGEDAQTIFYCEQEQEGFVPIDMSDLDETEKACVLRDAALSALYIALHRDNYREFGSHLLNKYPECRVESSVDAAIIEACYRERRAVYTDYDYEKYALDF